MNTTDAIAVEMLSQKILAAAREAGLVEVILSIGIGGNPKATYQELRMEAGDLVVLLKGSFAK